MTLNSFRTDTFEWPALATGYQWPTSRIPRVAGNGKIGFRLLLLPFLPSLPLTDGQGIAHGQTEHHKESRERGFQVLEHADSGAAHAERVAAEVDGRTEDFP